MKVTVTRPAEIDVAQVFVSVPVRYGTEDIPADFPFRHDDRWEVLIDADAGRIRGWPAGYGPGECDMKVCDEGVYKLFDRDGREVAKVADYVPCCLPEDYGVYVRFKIAADGTIGGWSRCFTPKNVRASFFRREGD